jgi:hypothetical protein
MSEANGDRGYRDEVGAALERLEQLEEENVALRAELDRLEAPKRRAREHSARIAVLAVTAVVVMSAFTYSHSCPHRSTPRHRGVAEEARSRGRAPEFRAIKDGDDCSLPFYYDRNHVRHWKPACLVDTVE